MQPEMIGIIGGTGWLGGAIAQALIDTSFISADQLFLSNRSGVHPLAATGVQLVKDNQQLVAACSTIMLAVRPEQFDTLGIDAQGKHVISLMAGVPASKIRAATGASVVTRAMPNASVGIGRSFTPWHCGDPISETLAAYIQRLFETVGTAARVPTEECVDYLSALSGTGPAFPALLMTALTRQAVAAGVPEDIAVLAAKGVVVDASRLLESGDPQQLIDTLVGYRGVTAAALQSLMDEDFEGRIGRAVQAGADVARKGM